MAVVSVAAKNAASICWTAVMTRGASSAPRGVTLSRRARVERIDRPLEQTFVLQRAEYPARSFLRRSRRKLLAAHWEARC